MDCIWPMKCCSFKIKISMKKKHFSIQHEKMWSFAHLMIIGWYCPHCQIYSWLDGRIPVALTSNYRQVQWFHRVHCHRHSCFILKCFYFRFFFVLVRNFLIFFYSRIEFQSKWAQTSRRNSKLNILLLTLSLDPHLVVLHVAVDGQFGVDSVESEDL